MKGKEIKAMDPTRLNELVNRPGTPKYLAHWVLKSAQREDMVNWYKNALSMEIVFENDMLTFLSYDEEHHRLAIIGLPKVNKPMARVQKVMRKLYGLDHIAFNFGSLRELLIKYLTLKSVGILPIWCINHGPTTSIYYEDPDGNRLEFQSDNFDSLEDLQRFGVSLEFDKNPIGVNFDPDLLWERLEAGVPLEELQKRGSATPVGTKPIGGLRAINWRTL